MCPVIHFIASPSLKVNKKASSWANCVEPGELCMIFNRNNEKQLFHWLSSEPINGSNHCTVVEFMLNAASEQLLQFLFANENLQLKSQWLKVNHACPAQPLADHYLHKLRGKWPHLSVRNCGLNIIGFLYQIKDSSNSHSIKQCKSCLQRCLKVGCSIRCMVLKASDNSLEKQRN